MPLVMGCMAPAAVDCAGAGDSVDIFSYLTLAPEGLVALALLAGRGASVLDSCEDDLAMPLTWGAGRDCVCWPLTPADTIARCRAKASLSTLTPGVGELRC